MKRLPPGIVMAYGGASTMLFLASVWQAPYGYYTLLRWVVCCVCAFGAFQAAEHQKSGWAWSLGSVGLLFNPLFPVHLGREIWKVVDIGTGVLLLVAMCATKVKSQSP